MNRIRGFSDRPSLWWTKNGAKPLTISIVDDDRVGLRAVEQMLKHAGVFEEVSVYASGHEALAGLRAEVSQVVLMDIRMPGMSGIECTRHLKTLLPEIKVLMVTALVDTNVMSEALSAGADGYLTKPFTVGEGLQAIRLALCGGTPMSKDIVRELETYLETAAHRPLPIAPGGVPPPLNRRESMVIQLLSEGFQYKEISDQLRESVFLVQKLAHRIYRKLEVHNRTEATNKWRSLSHPNPLPSGMDGKNRSEPPVS